MSNQLQITGGGKVRNLEGVITGTSGVLSSVPLGAANGVATLDSGGKVPVSQLPSSVVTYLGTWNAATNTPTLVNGTGDAGDMYICNVAGTVNFGAGPVVFVVGDWVLYGSGTWQKSSGQNGTVTSVGLSTNGGAITIGSSPVTTSGTISFNFNGTNLQYVNGAGNLTTFPTLTGYVPYTGATGDVNLGLYSLTSNAIKVIGDNSTYGGTLSIKQSNVTNLIGVGYTELFGKTNRLGISFGAGSIAYLSNSTLTAERTYTLPDASGTIALTSDIPSLTGYVPYTGATTDVNLGVYDLTADLITGATGSFASSGGSDTFAINHSSGSGIALNITKGGNGEGLYINKTSGSGNAATIVGTLNATTLVKSGGTSSQFLKADGTVDSNTYALDSLVVHLAGTETITGAKTFSAYTTFTSTVDITSGLTFSNSGFTLVLQPPTLSVNRTVTLPNGTGTLALTSDISYPVTSVFGRTGAVVATSGDYTTAQVTEVTNLYYTDTRARLALSFAAGSGAYNSTTGVIIIPTNNNQITNGAGYITGNQTITLSGDVSGSGTTAITTTIGALKVTNAMLAGSIDLTTKVTGLLPDGNISSASTWNAKQNAITLTTTGTSGAATLVGATLNIPQYADAYTGTVTSVAALTIGTSGTDLSSSVANSTTTPVITLNVPTASATNRGALSSADWTTFNNKQATLSLTTTGTSGAATFSANTLNIPNYGSALSGYLPLTGGTLTGALSGTSATFVGNLNLQSTAGFRNINFYDNTNTNINAQIQYDQLTSNTGQLFFGTNNAGTFATRLTIASTGAATFEGQVGVKNANTAGYNFGVGSSSGNGMMVYNGSTGNSYVFNVLNDTTNGSIVSLYGSDRTTAKIVLKGDGTGVFNSTITATGFFESSDSRLKTLIQDNYQTKDIASITPKLYTKNGKVELGYYAQDFVGILDNAVSKGSDDMLSLSYREVLVAKVYALEQRIKELENK